jgi:hypothetical protein
MTIGLTQRRAFASAVVALVVALVSPPSSANSDAGACSGRPPLCRARLWSSVSDRVQRDEGSSPRSRSILESQTDQSSSGLLSIAASSVRERRAPSGGIGVSRFLF